VKHNEPENDEMNAIRIHWVAATAAYEITRVDESAGPDQPYVGTDGNLYPRHGVPTLHITAYAGDAAVIRGVVPGPTP